MREFSVTLREKVQQLDVVMLFCAVALSLLSVITLAASADAYSAGLAYARNQFFALAMGLICVGIISMIDYDMLIERLEYVFFGASVFLLIIVILFGEGTMGNENWISIPIINLNIQPTEFVKITFIINFSRHLDRLKHKINHPLSVLQILIHGGLIAGLVVVTGDDGMALVYLAIMAVMVFCSGISLWYIAGAVGLAVIVFPFLWEYMEEYQRQRILVGFNPDLDPSDKGYQSIISRECIVSGGFRGAGFSGGSRYFSLPAAQSDCLYSVLAEKFGFIGTFTYIILITVLIWRIILLAKNCRKNYASYICMGMVGMLIAQTLENIGMCLAIMPVVGITLPFFSYGGSSMLSMYMCLGVLQSISSHNRKYYFEREPD
ncbi:MAG: rod shape-determining protein RodA [Clostridia bacterium]|nr:rod shape-determining protein RodA [Clostridia bacterium]